MEKVTLTAQPRSVKGRKVSKLREEGIIPANIFAKNTESRAIEINRDIFNRVYQKAGETTLIELIVGEEKTPVLISNVQYNPLTNEHIHVDFHAVNLKEKVTATVPVELVGESPTEKSGLGTVVLQLDEIEVEALPMDLPEKFEIDATLLTEVDQTIFVKDLKVDSSKVEIKEELDAIVVKVEPPQKEEVVAPPVVETATEEGAAEAPAEEAKEGEEATAAPQNEQ